MSSRRSQAALAVVLASALTLAGFTAGRATRAEPVSATPAPVAAQTGGALPPSFAPLVKTAAPAVVHVKVTSVVKAAAASPFEDFTFPGFRFPTPPRGEQTRQGLGSGFIIRKDSNTVTPGIVSAKGRAIGGPYDDFIQTDATRPAGRKASGDWRSRTSRQRTGSIATSPQARACSSPRSRLAARRATRTFAPTT